MVQEKWRPNGSEEVKKLATYASNWGQTGDKVHRNCYRRVGMIKKIKWYINI